MAELQTRIALKYDSYVNWSKWYAVEKPGEALDATPDLTADTFSFDAYANKGAALVLNRGEIGLCEIPTGSDQASTAPTVLFKVGDGTHRFCELKWSSALAADVYDWAKAKTVEFSSDDSTLYFKKADGSIISTVTLDLSAFAKKDTTEELASRIAEEAVNRETADSGLDTRIAAVEAEIAIFFKDAAKDEGEGENLKNALDTLVEIQEYINSDGKTGAQVLTDVTELKSKVGDSTSGLIADVASVSAAITDLEDRAVTYNDNNLLAGESVIIFNCGSSTVSI